MSVPLKIKIPMTAVSPVGFEDCSMDMSRHSSQQTATKTHALTLLLPTGEQTNNNDDDHTNNLWIHFKSYLINVMDIKVLKVSPALWAYLHTSSVPTCSTKVGYGTSDSSFSRMRSSVGRISSGEQTRSTPPSSSSSASFLLLSFLCACLMDMTGC